MTSHCAYNSGMFRQRGTALVMALVFLVVLTILGMSTMNTTLLQERMSGNLKDRQVAFQAAESALISAENWLGDLIERPVFVGREGDGLHPSTTTGIPVWDTIDWTSTADLVVYPNTPDANVAGSLNGVRTQPKYIVEEIGEQPAEKGLVLGKTYSSQGAVMYRITAAGTGGSDAARAKVQSAFGRVW